MSNPEDPPMPSPSKSAAETYAFGADAGDLAARARELGLERRAALLARSREHHSLYGGAAPARGRFWSAAALL